MAKKCIVYETLGSVTDAKIVKENIANSKEVRLSGVFGVCGIKNGNNRIYSKENYGRMVESLQNTIKTEGCLGELEHPNSMNINLNNVSHKIESINMNEDGTITGSIVLLDTEKGRNAKAIIESGCPLYVSSRALGTIDEGGHVTLSMLKTYDLVGTPGFSQASMHLDENQKFESLNESLDNGNIAYAIVEDDESNDDDSKKKKDDDSKEKKDDNKKDKLNTNMADLKEAIDKLGKKVESLEAQLHIAQESLKEKDDEIAELKESFKPINYNAIEAWITEEFAPDFRSQIADGVQKWITEEYSPILQNWVTEEFAPEVQDWVTEEFAPQVQNWITEEYSPTLQKWITEEYSPEIQNWIVEEYSPSLQNWITEEYSGTLQNWITEEFGETMENKINENVSEYLESKTDNKFDNIDRMLEALEGSASKDTTIQMLKEQQEKQLGKYANVYAIKNMPGEYRPMFEGLSDEKKDQIALQSRAYDFTKAGVLESFWANIDFNDGRNNPQQVNENAAPQQVNPQMNFMNSVAAQMKAMRG